MMIIRVDAIPREGLTLDFEENLSGVRDMAGVEGFSIPSPVRTQLTVTASDGGIYIDGRIRADLKLTCSRCLKEFTSVLDTPVSIFFSKSLDLEKEKELKTEDLEVNYLEGPEIDTKDIIIGQIALEMPMKPLCTEGCRGICQKCGKDLNEGLCGCEEASHAGSKFAKLKDFKVK